MPTKVFVGNLPDECAKDTIRDVFGPYGVIDDVAVVKNFAFVHFSSEGDANNAVRDLDGSKIGGKQINVEISKKQDNARSGGGGGGGRRDREKDRDRERNDRGGGMQQRRGRMPERSMHVGGILGAGPLGLGGPMGGGNGVGNNPNIGGLPAGPLAALAAGPPLGGLGVSPLAGLGALAGAGAGPLGGLFSAVSTFAAVAEKQQQLNSNQQQQQQQQPMQQQSFQDRRPERDQPDPDVRVRREVVPTRDVPNAAAMGLTNGYVIYERYYVDPSHPLLKGLPLPELPRMSDNLSSNNARNDNRRDNCESYRDRSPVHNGRRNDIDRDHHEIRDINNFRR